MPHARNPTASFLPAAEVPKHRLSPINGIFSGLEALRALQKTFSSYLSAYGHTCKAWNYIIITKPIHSVSLSQ